MARRSALAQHLGFRNITKGLRALDAMCEPDLTQTSIISALRVCSPLRGVHLEVALAETKRRITIDEDEKMRSDFTKNVRDHIPHLWFEHERRIPSPTYVVAFLGGASTF